MRRLSRLIESSVYVRVHNDSEHSRFASAHRNCFTSAPCSLLRLHTRVSNDRQAGSPSAEMRRGRHGVVTLLNAGIKELHVL